MRAKSWVPEEPEKFSSDPLDPYELAAQAFQNTTIPIHEFYDDPVGFIDEYVIFPKPPPGQLPGLTEYQREIMALVPIKKRLAVRGPHGLGKTTTNALTLIWFALTRDAAGVDWKVVTTAGAWRQLEYYLWPEIRKWAGCLDWGKLGITQWKFGKDLMSLSLKLKHGEAFAVASSDKEKIEGAHADSIMYIFDESKAIAADIFDAAEGAFSGGGDAAEPTLAEDGRPLEALAVATSTPGEPSGRFYDIHSGKPGYEDWTTRHVKLVEVIKAKRINRTWADQRARQWGEDSALYANRVLGEFHSSPADSTIPLAWVEAAVGRWHDWMNAGGRKRSRTTVLGVDIALGGADMTAIATRRGVVLEKVERLNTADTLVAAAAVQVRSDGTGEAVIDSIGVGAGVIDQSRVLGLNVRPFTASHKSYARDRSGEHEFINRRAEIWWLMRERLDPAFGSQICLPDDPELIAELIAPKWKESAGGKIQVESKDDLKKRLGRSTDSADAVLQTWASPESIDESEQGAGPMASALRQSTMSDVERFMAGGDLTSKDGAALAFGSTENPNFVQWEQEL